MYKPYSKPNVTAKPNVQAFISFTDLLMIKQAHSSASASGLSSAECHKFGPFFISRTVYLAYVHYVNIYALLYCL